MKPIKFCPTRPSANNTTNSVKPLNKPAEAGKVLAVLILVVFLRKAELVLISTIFLAEIRSLILAAVLLRISFPTFLAAARLAAEEGKKEGIFKWM